MFHRWFHVIVVSAVVEIRWVVIPSAHSPRFHLKYSSNRRQTSPIVSDLLHDSIEGTLGKLALVSSDYLLPRRSGPGVAFVLKMAADGKTVIATVLKIPFS